MKRSAEPLTRNRGRWAVIAAAFCLPAFAGAEEKVTYVDHVLPVLENKCFSCHNPDKKKGGLDLSTYSAAMAGGFGGSIVQAGDPDASRMFLMITKKEEPFMPPEGDPLPTADIEIIKKWIAGGVLETETSVAKKASPGVDLTKVASVGGKPENPAMPKDLLLEPVVTTPRGTAIRAMAASPWAPVIAVAGQKQILLYDITAKELAGILPYPEGFPQHLSFSPNGSLLVAGGGRGGKSGNVVVYDVENGKRVAEIGREFDTVLASGISADHSLVSLGGPSKKVKTFSTVTGEEIYSIKKHTDWVLSVAFSPDGILLASADRNGGLYVWEAENGGEFYMLGGHSGPVNDLAWRSDSNVLASAGEDGTVRLWAMSNGKEVKKWAAHGGGVLSIAFAPDGKIVTAGRDKIVKLWDAAGAQLKATPPQEDIVTKVAFSHASDAFFSADWTGKIRMWKVADGAQAAEFVSNPPTIASRIAALENAIPEERVKADAAKQAFDQIIAAVQATQGEMGKAQAELTAVKGSKGTEAGAMKQAEAQLAAATAKQSASANAKAAADAAQKKIAEVTVKLQPVQAELVSADGAVKAKEAEVAAAKKAMDEAIEAYAKKMAELERETARRAGIASRIDAIRKEMPPTPDMGKIMAEIAASGEAVKAAQGLLASKRKVVQELTAKEVALDQTAKALAPKLEELKKAEMARKGAADSATGVLVKLERALPRWKAAQFNVGVIKAREEQEKLELELAGHAAVVDEAVAAVDAVNARIAGGKKVMVESPAKIGESEKRAVQFGAEIAAMETQIAVAKQATQPLQQKRNSILAAVSLKQQHIAAIAEVGRLTALVAEKAKLETAAAAPLTAAQAKLDGAKKALADLNAKMAALTPALAAKEQAIAAAQAELAKAQKERDVVTAQANRLRGARDLRNQSIAAAGEAKKLQDQIGSVEGAIAQKEAARVEAENQLAVARENQEAIAVQSRAKEQATQSAIAAVADMEKSAESMRRERGTAEAEVARLRNAIAAKKRELESKQSAPAGNPGGEESEKPAKPVSGSTPPAAKPVPAAPPLPNPPPAPQNPPAKPAAPSAPAPAKPTEGAKPPAPPATTPAPPEKKTEAPKAPTPPATPTTPPAPANPATTPPAPAKPPVPAPAKPNPAQPAAPKTGTPPAPATPPKPAQPAPPAPPKPLTPQQELEKLQTQLAAAEKLLAEATAKIQAQESALQAKRAEMEKENAELERLKAALAEAPKAVAAAEAEVKKNQDAVNTARAAKTEVEKQLAAQRAKIAELEKQYRSMLPK